MDFGLGLVIILLILSLPIRAANPLTKVSVPKPDVRSSRPHISTMAGLVTAHQAERKAPNMTETITKAQYSSQKGMARGAIPPVPRSKHLWFILHGSLNYHHQGEL